jgi:WD40 repeat protein
MLRGQNCAVLSAAFSFDGDILITGGERIDTGEGQITLWDTATGAELGRLEGHQSRVWWLACSPVADLLASADAMGVVKVWELSKRTTRLSISTGCEVVMALTFSRDGEILLAAVGQRDDGVWEKECEVRLWHVNTGKPAASLSGHRTIVMSSDFSPDGTLLATGSWDGTIKLWNVATWTEQATIPAHPLYIFGVAFSPDGKTLASGSGDATVKLWQIPSGEKLCTLKQADAVYWVAFSPDGKTLALSHPDKSVKLLHAAIGRQDWPVSLR